MASRSNGPSLIKIIVVLCFLLGCVFCVYRATIWYGENYSTPKKIASATDSIEQARAMIHEGRWDEAAALLQPIVDTLKDEMTTPEASLLLAEALGKKGLSTEAANCLKSVIDAYPSAPARPRVMIAYAQYMAGLDKLDDARAVYDEVRQTAPPELRAPALTGLGRILEKEGTLVDARDLYRQAVKDAPWDSPEWNEALDALGAVNVALIFAPEETPDSRVYEIAPGDNFTSIGIKLNTTLGLLLRANRLQEDSKLNVGQRLKYTPKDFRIVIERSKCRLFLLDKDGIFKRYKVGLGMPGHETTPGEYMVGNKQKDPTWFKPGFGPIAAGDPQNELGTRWMPLVPVSDGLPTDLGIHGTIAPETVGFYSSHGCARMIPADVEELYDLIVRSTPVSIVETYTPGGTVNPTGNAPIAAMITERQEST